MADRFPNIPVPPTPKQLWFAQKLWSELSAIDAIPDELRQKHQASEELPEISVLIDDLLNLKEAI